MKVWARKSLGVVCLVISFSILGCTSVGTNSSQAQGGRVGDMQDFTLMDTRGRSVTLSTELATHKAVLVNFWATWCPPCREEIPGLIHMQSKYGGQGFTVLGISIGEAAAKASAFAGQAGMNYPILLDSDRSVAEMYQITGIPTSYLVNSEGKILGEYHAYSPELVADVEKALAS